MICKNCNRPIDNDGNFCKYCGDSLKETTDAALNTQYSIFGTQHQQNSNTEMGYLIIALIIAFNIFLWIFWTLVLNPLDAGPGTIYNAIRIISIILSMAQFVVMFIYAKKQTFRIVIGIIAGIVFLYDLFYLVRTLTTTSNF